MNDPIYSRVLLKLSGEILAGKDGFGIDLEKALLAQEVKSIHTLGVGIGLIIGAGNIIRGVQAANHGMERVTGDYLGMLATIINAVSLQDALEQEGCETRTLSAINITQIAEPISEEEPFDIWKKVVLLLLQVVPEIHFSQRTLLLPYVPKS